MSLSTLDGSKCFCMCQENNATICSQLLTVTLTPQLSSLVLLYTISCFVILEMRKFICFQAIFSSCAAHDFQLQKHQRGDTSLREKLLGAKDGGASGNNHQPYATIPTPSSPIPVNTKFTQQHHAPNSPTSDYYYV